MFWIICLPIFFALCAAWMFVVRRRGMGSGGGISDDLNHEALQNAQAKSGARHAGSDGTFGPGF